MKRVSGGAAVGHWGTLDPTACGVLLLAVGKATKLLPLLPNARKQYVFELVVGERTETGDAAGAVVATAHVAGDWARGLEKAAASLLGSQMQIPPMHSAVKIGGRPLYRSARKGFDVARAPRATVIHEIRIIANVSGGCQIAPNTARLFVECDAGTYVRVLCEEIGRRLNLPARMGALLRVASGPFLLSDSVRPQQIAVNLAGCLVNPLAVLPNRRVDIDERSARRFIHGNETRLDCASSVAGRSAEGRSISAQLEPEVLVTRGDELLGCGHVFSRDGADVLAPTRVFAETSTLAQGSAAEEAND